MLSSQPEILQSPEVYRNLQAAITLISKTLASDIYPKALKPPDGWQSVRIMDDDKYEREIIDSSMHQLHQFRLQRVRFKEEARKISRESMMRVSPDDGVIKIRRPLVSDNHSVDYWVSQLSHELGHVSSVTIEEPLNHQAAENLSAEINEAGFSCSPSDLTLWRHGLLEVVNFKGKQVGVPTNETEIYGNFFDELYANIFRLYLVAHVFMVERKMSFKQAVASLRRWPPLYNLSEAHKKYFAGIMEYAKEVGWEKLIRAGMCSDLKGFLAAGDETLDKKRNQKLLNLLFSLQGRFRLSGIVYE